METHRVDPRKAGRTLLWIYGAALLYFVLKQCCCLAFLRGFADEGKAIGMRSRSVSAGLGQIGVRSLA